MQATWGIVRPSNASTDARTIPLPATGSHMNKPAASFERANLPEAAPPDIMLAQVFHARRLRNQLRHLPFHIQLLVALEVPPRQLLLHPTQHLHRARVLHLLRLARSLCLCRGLIKHRRTASAHVAAGRAWLLLLRGLELADDALAALGGEGRFGWGFAVAETPVEEGVVDEGLEHGHQGFLVVADDAHDGLAAELVAAVDVADFHGEGQHAREAEGDALGVFLAVHGDFEAVAEVDVDDLAGDAVEHEVAGVPVAEAEDVADHGHDGEGAGVVGATLEPGLGGFGFEPEDAVEVLAGGVVHGVGEDFYLLHQGEVVEVGRHL